MDVEAITLTIRVWPGLGLGGITGQPDVEKRQVVGSYNDLAGRNGSGHCGDATMPRDTPVGSSRR